MADPDLNLLLDDDEPLDARYRARELLARLLPYYAAHRVAFLQAFALLFGTIGLGLVAPLLLGQVIDVATQGGAGLILPVPADRRGIALLAGGFVAVVVVGFLLEAALGFLMARVGVAMVIQLKQDLFERILTLDPGFFRDYPPGRLIARVESDTEALKSLFSSTALQLARATLTFGGIFVCMAWFDLETTLTVVPVLLTVAVLTAVFVTFVRALYHRSRRYLAAITGLMAEYVQGVEVVQHHDYAPQAEARLDELQRARLRTDVKADFLSNGFWAFFGLVEVATAGLVLWVGVGKVVAGTMTIGTLVVFLEYLRQVFMPIMLLSEFVAQIQRGLVAATRIFTILGLRSDVAEPEDGPAALPLTEALRLEDVRFSYDGRAEVLRGVDLEIRKGQTVALVGPSGGGKSSLVNLLLRFYDPSAGRITVDGVDLRAASRHAWRTQVGWVPQEVYLFPGTLAENITCFDERRPLPEVEAAVRHARAERLLEALPGGLEAELAERGSNLSHGERQLVSLARALVDDPQLLVLDEATSSIDPDTEARIQASLDRLLAGRTALIVAHRLSTIQRCDLICVVKDGRIVERGTHDELWAQGGHYRALASLQLAEAGAA